MPTSHELYMECHIFLITLLIQIAHITLLKYKIRHEKNLVVSLYQICFKITEISF